MSTAGNFLTGFLLFLICARCGAHPRGGEGDRDRVGGRSIVFTYWGRGGPTAQIGEPGESARHARAQGVGAECKISRPCGGRSIDSATKLKYELRGARRFYLAAPGCVRIATVWWS